LFLNKHYLCFAKSFNLEKIYNSIKKDIKNHPDVHSSILGMVPDWKRSQFVILAELISDHLSSSALLTEAKKLNLGTTISPITLQRFFENEYQVKTHNDLRFIKTLDKVCIFLGKNDLNDYINNNFKQDRVVHLSKEAESDFSEKELVKKFCKLQFEALRYLPNINLEEISTTVSKDSPLLKRIALYFEEKRKSNLAFVNENNRSNYEIFQITKISDDPELKVVKTQEFWNLVFKDDQENNYVVHHLNTQFYFIKKTDGLWKIWDNYNPDYGKILKIN